MKQLVHLGTTEFDKSVNLLVFGNAFRLAKNADGKLIDGNIFVEAVNAAKSAGYDCGLHIFNLVKMWSESDEVKQNENIKFYIVYNPFKHKKENQVEFYQEIGVKVIK